LPHPTCTPNEYYYLPDTAGGNFEEFEILPSYRMAGAVAKFPCVLYINPTTGSERYIVEHALNEPLNGSGPGWPIPDPAPWDRYDYLDAATNWFAPLFRNAGGNAGASMKQLLGYRMILVETGNLYSVMDARDWNGIAAWLDTTACGSNSNLQGFLGSGNNFATMADGSLLLNRCGFSLLSSSYRNASGNSDCCVELVTPLSSPPPFPYTLWGNCQADFDVIRGSGMPDWSLAYHRIGDPADYYGAQVSNDQRAPGSSSNYRTVVNGYSLKHLTTPRTGDPCPTDSATVLRAVARQLGDVLTWCLNLNSPLNLGLCVDPCLPPWTSGQSESEGDGPINRLYQNLPNPLNPSTVIRYSMAAGGR
jgi:hypothetical protein